MKTLLLRIKARVQKTGEVRLADIERIKAYAYKHPMWAALASAEEIAAYKALVAAGERA